jgi:hypothetical protein
MVFPLLRVGLMRSDPLAELFKALSAIDAVDDGPELQDGCAVRSTAPVVLQEVTGLARALEQNRTGLLLPCGIEQGVVEVQVVPSHGCHVAGVLGNRTACAVTRAVSTVGSG